MKKLVLNRYSYILENTDSKKLVHINEIVAPLKKVESASQNPGGYGETSHQRSVLVEVDDSISIIDYENHVYTSKNPICEKLLSFEKTLDRVDTFKVVINQNGENTFKQYKILSKTLRKDS